MNILFLRGFNNYFNRIVKKYSTLTDYQNNSASYLDLANINFNPNDGVVTELIIGNTDQKENNTPLAWDTIGTPDYAVCYEMEGTPAAAVIKFRWFVLESERTRSGQYRIALKRDVIAEHLDQIKEVPCYIEKGMISDINNPLLYNKESMTYNQIKTEEYLLKDSTDCGWIVGYIPKNKPNSTDVTNLPTITTEILLEGNPSTYYDEEDLPFRVSESNPTYANDFGSSNISIPIVLLTNNRSGYATNYGSIYQQLVYLKFDNNGNGSVYESTSYSPGDYNNSSLKGAANSQAFYNAALNYNSNLSKILFTWPNAVCDDAYKLKYNSAHTVDVSISGATNGEKGYFYCKSNSSVATAFNNLKAEIKSNLSTGVVDNLTDYIGKTVKIGNKFYQIAMEPSSYVVYYYYSGSFLNINKKTYVPEAVTYNNLSSEIVLNTDVDALILSNSLVNESLDCGSQSWSASNPPYYSTTQRSQFGTFVRVLKYKITLTNLSTETLSLENRVYTSRNQTYDNSADLFAIPYGETPFITTNGGTAIYTTKARGLAMARALASAFSDSCYDLQLLPYCPSAIVRDYYETYEYLPIWLLESKSCQLFTATPTGGSASTCGYVLWCSSSKGSFDIDIEILPDIGEETDSQILKYKLSNETQICRLASPNFNGQFELSVAKNNGISKVNVDYTYKPYSPYIHINPDFKYIYGRDWDDARGLICGGDFSLAHITSYWQTYMNNNKNYQQIFDRQIQNIDINNSIAMEKQEFQASMGTLTSAISGTLSGGAAGASVGALGGPWGAVIGGVVGAVGGGLTSGLASNYGAQKDIDWLQRQQQEARSYAVDMYGYQLGNIQAIPYSIKGTDALTNNNKIWPIIEIYNATDDEIGLLKSKIQYNGMTVMAIGKISDYIKSNDFELSFIKGQFIRLDNINDDFHIADAIYQEINKGVYIPSVQYTVQSNNDNNNDNNNGMSFVPITELRPRVRRL